MAFDHQVEYHVPNNTVPNRHYQFEHQLDRHEQKYIHAEIENYLNLH
jgi:hypothetical protein